MLVIEDGPIYQETISTLKFDVVDEGSRTPKQIPEDITLKFVVDTRSTLEDTYAVTDDESATSEPSFGGPMYPETMEMLKFESVDDDPMVVLTPVPNDISAGVDENLSSEPKAEGPIYQETMEMLKFDIVDDEAKSESIMDEQTMEMVEINIVSEDPANEQTTTTPEPAPETAKISNGTTKYTSSVTKEEVTNDEVKVSTTCGAAIGDKSCGSCVIM